jgi:hypothetical protein
MRFLCLYKPARPEGLPPSQQEMAEMGKFIEELVNEGVLLATEGCQPTSKGARVRLTAGKFTVTDGPFVETKELIGGFAIVQAKSRDEAIELTRRFLKVAGDGESEIRQLYEPSDFPPEIVPPEEVAREQAWREALQKKGRDAVG